MNIKDIMTTEVQVLEPNDTLQTAAQKMRGHDIGLLPICDNDRLVGVVSDRDLAIRATAEGLDPRSTKVSQIKSDDVAYCYDDQSVEEAARVMQERQIRRLVVLDRKDKRMVGIVALGDVATNGTSKTAGEVLEVVSEAPGQL
jgi:CBS domain-containing protein